MKLSPGTGFHCLRIAPLLVLLGMLPFAAAYAQMEEPRTAAPWLQVELVVFRHLDYALAGDEAWPAKPLLGYPPDIQILRRIDELLAQPPTQLPTQIELAATPLLAGAAEAVPVQELPFVLLPPEQRTLGPVASRIASSASYRLLAHSAWRQPAPAPSQPTHVLLTGGETHGEHFELEGYVAIERSRFLHVDSHLWLNEFAAVPMDSVTGQGIALPAVPRPIADELEMVESWSQPVEPVLVSRSVLLEQRRRLRFGELHYLDHPLFSLIVKLQPYDPAAVESAADETPEEDESAVTADPAALP